MPFLAVQKCSKYSSKILPKNPTSHTNRNKNDVKEYPWKTTVPWIKMTFCATAVSCSGRPLHRQHSGYLSGFGLLEASSYPETTSRSAWPPNPPSHRLITSWQPTAINMLVYATTCHNWSTCCPYVSHLCWKGDPDANYSCWLSRIVSSMWTHESFQAPMDLLRKTEAHTTATLFEMLGKRPALQRSGANTLGDP